MITFPYPWLMLLIPVPLIAAWILPAYRTGQSSIRIPRLNRLSQLTGRSPTGGAVVLKRTISAWLALLLAWTCVVLAIARPQWVGEPMVQTLPSRDLLLAVDLSGSMNTEDFTDANGRQVDRLNACKQVLDGFLTRRQGDRVGLIFFGTAAFVQAPFTEDLELCRTLLNEAQVGMAGPQTVIGDAIGLSLTVFERSQLEDRVLILLTDGNDTGSKITPQEAARIAEDKGVTIYTIAVGDPQAVGEEKIDEVVLQEVAKQTGGSFYRASDREQLEQIYEELDEIVVQELETESYLPKTDLYFWPLGAFLIIGIAYHGACGLRHGQHSSIGTRGQAALATLILVIILAGANRAEPEFASASFHFLRPLWLLAILPAFLIVVAMVRQQDKSYGFQRLIAPHLLKHLLVKPESDSMLRPVHLLSVAWMLATIGIAGPTWQREPSPFAHDQAAVVFAQEVTPTMLAQDIQPSRLQRSVHKIRDLLTLRPGTDAALIAYSGSAHLVIPITGDAEIIESFASELDPSIMPVEGDAASDAVQLATEQLRRANRPGSIVLLTDGIDADQIPGLSQLGSTPIHILAVGGDQSKPLPLNSPAAPAIDIASLKTAANAAGATLTIVSPDEQDVKSLSREITSRFVAAQQDDGGDRWKDMGYWLTPFTALIVFFWFRPGWIVPWE